MNRRPAMETWQRNLWSVVIAEVLALLSFAASNLLIPYYVQQMGLTDPTRVASWTGIYQSLGGVAFAIFTPIWGAIGDRYGRKPMLVRAMVVTVFVQLGMGLSQTPTQLLICRFLQGAFTGTPAAATALLATGSPRHRLAYSLGLLQTALFVGQSLGPMVGGFVADTMGYRATFFVSAAIVFAGFLIVLLLVHEPEQSRLGTQKARTENPITAFRSLLGSRVLLALIGLSLLGNLTFSLLSPVLPLYIQQLVSDPSRLASTAGSISGVAAMAAAVSALVVGRLSDRVGYRRALTACTLGTTLLYLPQMWAGTAIALGATLGLQGLFRGGIGPNISAMVAQTAPEEKVGSALGLSSSASSAGFALGPMLGALVLNATSIRGVYVVAMAMLAVVTAIILSSSRSPSRTQSA